MEEPWLYLFYRCLVHKWSIYIFTTTVIILYTRKEKLSLFYKIVSGDVPEYLCDLLPNKLIKQIITTFGILRFFSSSFNTNLISEITFSINYKTLGKLGYINTIQLRLCHSGFKSGLTSKHQLQRQPFNMQFLNIHFF